MEGDESRAQRSEFRVPSFDFQVTGANSVRYVVATTFVILSSVCYLNVELGVLP